MSQIIRNAIRTPDGTILESHHRHDYKAHTDANGEFYMVDGGFDYLRRTRNVEKAEVLDVYLDDPYEEVREAFLWGTYGKNPSYAQKARVPLCKLSNPHISAIIRTQVQLSDWMIQLFIKELVYRKENDIFIEEVESYEGCG